MRMHLIYILLFGICISTGNLTFASPGSEQAWQYIHNKQLDQAENSLAKWLENNALDAEAQHLLARVKGWQGKFPEAFELVNQLTQRQPENTDYLFTLAQLYSWENRIDEALQVLARARTLNPQDQAIWKLELNLLKREPNENRLQQAQELFEEYRQTFNIDSNQFDNLLKPKIRHTLLSFISFENYTNNIDNGRIFHLSYSNQLPLYQYSLSTEKGNRYSMQDYQIQFSVNKTLSGKRNLGTAIQASSSGNLFSKHAIGINYGQPISSSQDLFLQFEHRNYRITEVGIVQLALGQYWRSWQSRISLFFSSPAYSSLNTSAKFSGSYHFSDENFIRLSITKGEEREYILDNTTNIQNVTLDSRYQVLKNFSVFLLLANHQQGNAYTKNEFTTGIYIRF